MRADTTERLSTLGERRIVSELLAKRYHGTTSFGDDCAVIPQLPTGDFELVATTDPCPEPLVASLGWKDLYYYGWLLGTINFSDLAAAGAEPLGLLVSYMLPKSTPVADFERLMDGVDDCCRKHGSQVVGGNIGDAESIQLTATAIGACDPGKRLSRRGARAGDAILLVGSPGYLWGAALLHAGYAQLSADDEHLVFERALKPVAQLRAGRLLAATGQARAAIDISDGLYPSVEALCLANNLGAVIDAMSPVLDPLPLEICRQASADPFDLTQLWGDWSLLVAVDHVAAEQTIGMLTDIGIGCHRIGSFQVGEGVSLKRGGQLLPWHGMDAERFTESSWARSKVPNYLAKLVDSPSATEAP